MLFDNLNGLLRVLVVAPLAYVAVILVLRSAGKRALAKLNAFDLVVTVALGSTLATVVLSKDVALAEGALAFAALALLQWLVSRFSTAWSGFANAVRSQPRLLLENGHFVENALEAERVTRDEAVQAIRDQGIGRLNEVAAVVLESDGSMSVIPCGGEGELTVLSDVRRD